MEDSEEKGERWKIKFLPAEDTENEIHNKEGTENDHGHKIDELPGVPLRVVDLEKSVEIQTSKKVEIVEPTQ